MRELIALRYGVDPILSAAAMRVFALRYGGRSAAAT
jgi:hypothetical protein